MRKAWNAAGKILFALASAVLLVACGNESRDMFVESCRQGAAPEDYCECVYDNLEDQYGQEVMHSAQTRAIFPEGFVERMGIVSASCRGVDVSNGLSPVYVPGEEATPVQDAAAAAPHSSDGDDTVVEQAISVTASALVGEEYRDARLSASGDVNGDGRDDAAVVFTIEVASANTATQNLSVFVRQDDGSLRFAGSTVVGSQGGAAVGRMAIEQGAVVLTTLSLGPNDPDCCPSVEENTRFELSGGALRQVP